MKLIVYENPVKVRERYRKKYFLFKILKGSRENSDINYDFFIDHYAVMYDLIPITE